MKEQLKGYIQNLKQRYHLKNMTGSVVMILVTALSIIGVFIVGSAQAYLAVASATGSAPWLDRDVYHFADRL